jgi:integrase
MRGLPHVRLHDLRHSCASLLLSKKVHPKLVQEQLGHSRIATTMDIYGHLIPALSQEVADTMDSIIVEGRAKQVENPVASNGQPGRVQ